MPAPVLVPPLTPVPVLGVPLPVPVFEFVPAPFPAVLGAPAPAPLGPPFTPGLEYPAPVPVPLAESGVALVPLLPVPLGIDPDPLAFAPLGVVGPDICPLFPPPPLALSPLQPVKPKPATVTDAATTIFAMFT